MTPDKADILIIGAGIVGITLARALAEKGFGNIVILEKESAPGKHASGRNSGVLHAGIYYSPDSLKAKFCLNGNRLMRAYCKEKGLKILETGKVIVTRTPDEIPYLEELYDRAVANGAKVEFIDEKQLAEIEPNAKTVEKAIFSHYTAMVDPKQVMKTLRDDVESGGKVKILGECAFIGLKGSKTAITSKGDIAFDRVVNAAGAHCDKVAHCFGAGRKFRMIPFKGIYWKLKKNLPYTVNGNIYPVPDIRNPFLGVHFTRSVHGDVWLGPTAIPAFGRENYGILSGIDSEGFSILLSDAALFFQNSKFREVAFTEPRKYLKSCFFHDAAKLVKQLEITDIEPSDKAGIRPQLVDWRSKELVMDFMLLADGEAVHILNPISPAFTGSMYLAETLVKAHFL